MVKTILLSCLLATVWLTGCGTVKSYKAETKSGEAHPDDYPIYIYPPDTAVPRDYEVVGVMKIRDTPLTVYGASLDKQLDDLRKKARKVGGDALKLTDVKSPGWLNAKHRVDAEIIRWAHEWERVPFTEEEFRAYLNQDPASLDPVEGIWAASDVMQTRVGIVKSGPRGGSDLVVFLIENANPSWKAGDIKAELFRDRRPGVYRGYYFQDDFQRERLAFQLESPTAEAFLLQLSDPDSAPVIFAREATE